MTTLRERGGTLRGWSDGCGVVNLCAAGSGEEEKRSEGKESTHK
jgi:hypothetical protein